MTPVSINPNVAIIKLKREDQINHREKIGGMYLSQQHVFLKQNLQHGEVVLIGEYVKKLFTNIEVGDTLLFHHFIEGTMQDKNKLNQLLNSKFLVDDSDPVYRFYMVPKEQIYAVSSFGTIETVPSLIFGQMIESIQEEAMDGNMVVINNYKKERDLVDQKLEALKKEAMELSKYSKGNIEVIKKIQALEGEMASITNSLNRKVFKPFHISATNKEMPNFADNLAWYSFVGEKPTTIDFEGNTFSILHCKHIGYVTPKQLHPVAQTA